MAPVTCSLTGSSCSCTGGRCEMFQPPLDVSDTRDLTDARAALARMHVAWARRHAPGLVAPYESKEAREW